MPADRKDLAARLAAATPADTVRGVMFNAMFDVIRERGSDALARQVDPDGSAKRTDFFSYPVASYLQVAWDASDALSGVAFDELLHAFGHRGCAGVLGSRLGKTLIAFSNASFEGLLRQTANAYRGAVSYGERSVEWVAPRHAKITFRRDFLVPPFHCGVFAAGAAAIGAPNAQVTGTQTGFLEALYEVRWE